MKRFLDVSFSFSVLFVFGPIIGIFMLLVWLQDSRSPFYIAKRGGRGGRLFNMVKLRSMVVDADKTRVRSTSAADQRITPIGRMIRRFKLDELTQFWNVMTGAMSVVGPRPQVPEEVAKYTPAERRMLDAKPGITDFASIVFSDENEILKESKDPDDDYDRIIRPWKSRLALLYVEKRNFRIDIELIFLTAVAILSRSLALRGVTCILRRIHADETIIRIASRIEPLIEGTPPGA